MSDIRGGCLCGAIRYQATDPAQGTFVCHCRDCQKQTGTAFSVVLALAEQSLIREGRAPARFVTQGASGQSVERFFCADCGSPLWSRAEVAPGALFLKAGTLDDPSGLVPDAHLWCDTAQPWTAPTGDVRRYPGNPA